MLLQKKLDYISAVKMTSYLYTNTQTCQMRFFCKLRGPTSSDFASLIRFCSMGLSLYYIKMTPLLSTTPANTVPNHKTILVVEDDSFIVTFLDAQLRKSYNTLTAQTTEQAEKLLAKHHVDLIVLDIILPQEDGLALLKRLKSANSPHKDIPVIILSNLDPHEDLERTQKLGAELYLVKGNLLPAEIVQQITAVLAKH